MNIKWNDMPLGMSVPMKSPDTKVPSTPDDRSPGHTFRVGQGHQRATTLQRESSRWQVLRISSQGRWHLSEWMKELGKNLGKLQETIV